MKINLANIKNNRVIRHIYYFMKSIVYRRALREKAKKTLRNFCLDFNNRDDLNKTLADMLRMYALFGYSFDEYLLFHFAEKTMKQRRSFVADWEHLGYTCAMNKSENDELFDNKWKTYQTFRSYFHRDVQICNGIEDMSLFYQFLKKHENIVIKPMDGTCGRGVKIINIESQDILTEQSKCEQLYKQLLKESNGRFIMEEFIIQSEETRKFHPASVNTVRVTTIRIGEKVHITNCFFRIGQHGKHVDNGGSGGIICAVEAESGSIFAAADEYGNKFKIQPDTGEQIIGYIIPRWGEAKNLVTELAKVVPDNHYTGWDLALTKRGWILVEANRRGQFLWQIPSQIGFRDEINHYLKQLGLKY